MHVVPGVVVDVVFPFPLCVVVHVDDVDVVVCVEPFGAAMALDVGYIVIAAVATKMIAAIIIVFVSIKDYYKNVL